MPKQLLSAKAQVLLDFLSSVVTSPAAFFQLCPFPSMPSLSEVSARGVGGAGGGKGPLCSHSLSLRIGGGDEEREEDEGRRKKSLCSLSRPI